MTENKDKRMQETEAEAFDARIHDAYESVELSPEAHERILGALLDAQAAREEAPVAQVAAAKVVELPRRRSWLSIALPAAACLALAFVVGRGVLSGELASTSDYAAEAVAQNEKADSYEAVSEEAAPAAAEAEAAESGAAPDAAYDALDTELPALALLDDGTVLDLDPYGGGIVRADASVAGDPLGQGVLLSAAGEELGPCEAFALNDGSEELRLVSVDGGEAFYLARVVD